MQKVLATQKPDYRYSWLHSSNWTWYKITGWQAANLIRSFAQLTADKRLLIEVCITDKSFNISYMKCISCIDNWDFNDIFAECSLWQVDRSVTASSIVLPTYLHVLSLWLMATTLAGASKGRRRFGSSSLSWLVVAFVCLWANNFIAFYELDQH